MLQARGFDVQLIVLPGLDGTGVLSKDLSVRLGKSFDVLAIRYPDDLCRYSDAAKWLYERLPTDDVVIVAESFSGPLAVMLAETRPANLKALVLVASFARSPRRFAAFCAMILYLLPVRSPVFIRLGRWFLVGKWGAKSFPQDFATITRQVPRRTLVGRLRQVLRVNVQGALRGLQLPRMLVSATADRLVPAARGAEFAAAGWEVVQIEGPHFLALTRPDAVAEAIERFLAANLPGP
jgi:pimeloyl-[acyl-carrier protein] methyl ester esterase